MASEDNLIILTLCFLMKMLLLHCVLVALARKNLIKEHPFAYVKGTASTMRSYTFYCDVRRSDNVMSEAGSLTSI